MRVWARLGILAGSLSAICLVIWFFTSWTANNVEKIVRKKIDVTFTKSGGINPSFPMPRIILVSANGDSEQKIGRPLREENRQNILLVMNRLGLDVISFVASYRLVAVLGEMDSKGDKLKNNSQIVFCDRVPKLSISGIAIRIEWPTKHVIKIYSNMLMSVSPEDYFIRNSGDTFGIMIYDARDIIRPGEAGPDAFKDGEQPKSERL